MIERLWKAQIPITWVVADSVYGGNLDLRTWLEAHGYPYVLAGGGDEPAGIMTPEGGRRPGEAREVEGLPPPRTRRGTPPPSARRPKAPGSFICLASPCFLP